MDVLARIRYFMEQKQWSEYKLSIESNVPQSTINSMFRKNNNPSIYTLQCICDALQISMSEFFNDDDNTDTIPSEYKDLIRKWQHLSQNQKNAILALLDTII